MVRRLSLLFLLTNVLRFHVAAQNAPQIERVPASQISGATLTAADGSFSVDAPTGWIWFRMPAADQAAVNLHPQMSSETYLAVDPNNRANSFILGVVRDGSHISTNREYMDGVGSGLTRTSPKTGWHISEYGYESASIPVAGAYHYHCVATSDTGVIKHRFGYVAGDDPKFNFGYSTLSTDESDAFRRFVASFKRLIAKGGA
jgi:hypothetical protein